MDVALAAGDASWESAAIREIAESSHLHLVRRCVDVADLLAVAETGVAAAVFVDVTLGGLDADCIFRLERLGVRVASVEADAPLARGLGIARQLRLGSLDEITRDAVVDTSELSSDRQAKVIAVWGPAGAPGRSTVALALASARAACGVDTVLVDADTYGGSQAQFLAVLDDVSGLMAACRAANSGRAPEVVDHLLGIDPHLRLLTGLPRADMWPQIRAGALELVLRQLRQQAQLVVVDCGFAIEPAAGVAISRDQATAAVLEHADSVVVVGRCEPVGLARLVRGLHELRDRWPQLEPTVVVNMLRTSLGWPEREVDATLRRLTGIAPAAFLPFDQVGLDAALMSGRTPRVAAPSSPFVSRIEALAATLTQPGVMAAALG